MSLLATLPYSATLSTLIGLVLSIKPPLTLNLIGLWPHAQVFSYCNEANTIETDYNVSVE